jgi:hypothetical protein
MVRLPPVRMASGVPDVGGHACPPIRALRAPTTVRGAR